MMTRLQRHIARVSVLALVGFCLATAPAAATTALFRVSLEVREAVRIVSDGALAKFPAEKMLGIKKPHSLSVEAFSCSNCDRIFPEVSFTTSHAQLVGPEGKRIQIKLFVVQQDSEEVRRLFLGGFLQEGQSAPEGVYRGNATVNILYQ